MQEGMLSDDDEEAGGLLPLVPAPASRALDDTDALPSHHHAPAPTPALSIPPLVLPRRPELPPSTAQAVKGMSDEELRDAQRIFHKFDVDGDGAISWADFLTAMRRLEPERAADTVGLRSMFDAVDTDADGYVRFPEFVQMQLKQERRSTKNLLALAGK